MQIIDYPVTERKMAVIPMQTGPRKGGVPAVLAKPG